MAYLEEVLPAYRQGKTIKRVSTGESLNVSQLEGTISVDCLFAGDWVVLGADIDFDRAVEKVMREFFGHEVLLRLQKRGDDMFQEMFQMLRKELGI